MAAATEPATCMYCGRSMELVSKDKNGGCVWNCTYDDCSSTTRTMPHSYYHEVCRYCGLMRDCQYTSYFSNYEDDTHTSGCQASIVAYEAFGTCPYYGDPVTESCSGGTATCLDYARCAKCGQSYGELGGHDYDCFWFTDTHHLYDCRLCGDWYDEEHTGGTYNCGNYPVCDICEEAYYAELPEHTTVTVPRKSATCTEPGYTESSYCSVCGEVFQESTVIPATGHYPSTVYGREPTCEFTGLTDGIICCVCLTWEKEQEVIPALGHTEAVLPYKDPICTEIGLTEGTYCSVCEVTTVEQEKIPALGHTETVLPLKDPTCTEKGLTEGAYCSVCGETTVAQEEIPTKGHRYRKTIFAPSCWKNGYTVYTCRVCSDSYTVEAKNATMHWFDLWAPNGDETHSASCRLCNYTGTAACVKYEVTIGEKILTVCPVCGEFGEAAFEALADTEIEELTKNAIPYLGELIVRGMEAPLEGAMYAFTAVCEYDGKPLPFEGTVSIFLPLDGEKYTSFKPVRVDVTEATEQTERTEVWTDVEYTFEEGVLCFETEVGALYLLVSETAAE